MATFNELVDLQKKTGEELQRIINNYKKDPADRKTTAAYYKERLQRINTLWDEYEDRDMQLRGNMEQPMTHEYFNSHYDNVREAAQSYQELFRKHMKKLEASEQMSREHTNEKIAGPTDGETNANNIHQGLIRKMTARMTALRRLINSLSTVHEGEPAEFYEININTIQQLWKQLEDLQDEAWEKMEDPVASGFNQKGFGDLEDMVRQKLVYLSTKAKLLKNSTTQIPPVHRNPDVLNTLPLPKVTIPQFNGDYLQWRPFFDLFSEMVDKQALPSVQKMWYLKANVSDEATKLISHFTLTEENYNAAWTLLQERYNNKRILVATLVQKLLDQPPGTSSAAAIKRLHDTTKECLLALNNLAVKVDTWDPLLLQILIKKLDRNTHIRFEQSLENPKELQKVSKFLSFLEMQFQSMEAMGQREKSSATQSTTRTVSSIVSSDSKACIVCNNGKHPLYYCNEFLQWSASKRLNWVQKQRLCVNCFRNDHMAKNCTSKSCTKCDKKHNSLLHLGNKTQNSKHTQSTNQASILGQSSSQLSRSSDQTSKPNQATSSTNSSAAEVKATVTSAATNKVSARQGYVLLATAKIRITAANGRVDEFRAILDSGSQINIVSERLIKRLGITPAKTSLDIEGIGNGQRRATQRVNIQMQSKTSKFSAQLEAFVLPNIIPVQPTHHLDIATWPIPNNIQLADPDFHQPGRIDVLLGAEFYYDLMTIGQIRLSNDLPVLQNTTLGWIVSGKVNSNSSNIATCAALGGNSADGELVEWASSDNNASLEGAIERLWKLDEIETNHKNLSVAEQLCEAHFAQNVQRNSHGRFIVRLPFVENTSALGDSRGLAYNRFLSLERRLLKNDVVRKQYIEFMEEYERLGHMKEVDINTIVAPNYFIPHHCVLKQSSSTTKLRVVFDASAKTTSGQSLNDLMYTGPTVQSELFSILLRFRFPRFVFTTDIEKMYRQILIHPDDQRYQVISWRKDITAPLKYYQLQTVTYGTRSAPYLATKCLQKIAKENDSKFPYGAKFLHDNFYVDDGLGGSDSLAAVIETQKQLACILKNAGFNLRKWCANHQQLLQDIPHEDQEVNLDFSNDSNEFIKTLGLIWLPKADKFCVKAKFNNEKNITKRTVSSDLARLFDPLGLLAPVIVKAKIFVQQLWQLKMSWDETLPTELSTIWASFRGNLDSLNNLQIPRHLFNGQVPLTTQLHVFADASEKAFGAAAYIRATLKNGLVIVRLLCAKSRVAPLKRQTLPRLELCAAVLAAQLATRVQKDVQMKDGPLFLWTDSEIVLSWINAQSSSFQTFVANRVAVIQSLTLVEQWRHVRSKDNAADVLSRGLSPSELSKCDQWFYGPLFLHGREDTWPEKFSPALASSSNLERKRKWPSLAHEEIALTISTKTTKDLDAALPEDLVYKINHRNSFRTLQRVVGYLLRFINNARSKKSPKQYQIALTASELDQAIVVIVKAIQISNFRDEITHLKKCKEFNKTSPLSSLTPFSDDMDILRVGGRLEASSLPFDAKHQMLLPYNDPIAKLMLVMMHNENMHCGPRTCWHYLGKNIGLSRGSQWQGALYKNVYAAPEQDQGFSIKSWAIFLQTE